MDSTTTWFSSALELLSVIVEKHSPFISHHQPENETHSEQLKTLGIRILATGLTMPLNQ